MYYIVRGKDSGVFFGKIEGRYGTEVRMREVRRIWYWDGACSISELAKSGTQKPENCRFTVTLDELTLIDAIEIIPCTKEAQKSILAVEDWKY